MGGTIHALTPGTILDNRYRLDSVLGQGGFGITYAALNIRVDLRVAIKELFWKGHSSRNAAVSPEVALEDERDAGQFAAQKKRFLEEAKAIRDFSGLPGIVRILDYFEENGTAYLVMEYAEGETLSAKIIREGPMPAEEIFRSFLPLMDSLAHVHRAGVIHRDISPDNIIVKPDGTLELIDFGAARQYLSVGEKGITSIAKDSYAPGEQYDRNGKQGPWTDIYSLCATLYTCTTGVTPPNAVQRMFLDELRKPTEAGASMEPAYEAVILKGLQLNASRRWQSMEEMAEAVRKVLPERTLPAVSSRKSVFRGVLAGILVAVLAIGIWTFVRNDRADRFGGKETVQVLVTPPNGMTTKEYDAARAVLIGRMEDFAGKDGYLLETESTNMLFTLPLETFGGTGIDEALQKVVRGQENEPDFRYQAEIVGCWEDPGTSATRGKNQVQPAELKGRTGIFVFTGFNELSPGERTNLYMDMKTRLDALGVPYAFGTEYGHDERIVFRMGMERLGPFVLHSIGSDQMRVVGELSGGGLSVSRNSFRANVEVSEEDGRCSLVLVSDSDYVTQQLEKRTAWLLSTGGNTLYLEAPSGHDALAETSFDAPITDGRIVFSRFRTAEPQEITAENRWIADYVAAVTTETRLPGTCSLEKSGAVREDGRTDFSGIKEDEFGLKLTMKKGEAELDRELRRYAAEKGYGYKKDYDSYFVGLNLTMDEGFTERAGAAVSEMAGRLHLDTAILNMPLRILLIGEEAYEFCRITIQTKYDIIFDSEDYGMEIYNWMDNSIGGSERMKAYRETFNTWWEQYPVEALGFSRSVFEDTRKEQ